MLDSIIQVFRNVLDNDSLKFTESATHDDIEGWDSLAHLMIVSELGQEFKLTFTMEEIMDMKKISDIIEIIEKKKR